MQVSSGPLFQSGIRPIASRLDFPEHRLLEAMWQFIPMRNDALSEAVENVIGRVSTFGIWQGGWCAPFIFPARKDARTVIQIVVP
jgi:hypothetical protein